MEPHKRNVSPVLTDHVRYYLDPDRSFFFADVILTSKKNSAVVAADRELRLMLLRHASPPIDRER